MSSSQIAAGMEGPEFTHHTKSPQARCDAAAVSDDSEQLWFSQAAGRAGFANDGHHQWGLACPPVGW